MCKLIVNVTLKILSVFLVIPLTVLKMVDIHVVIILMLAFVIF